MRIKVFGNMAGWLLILFIILIPIFVLIALLIAIVVLLISIPIGLLFILFRAIHWLWSKLFNKPMPPQKPSIFLTEGEDDE